MSVRLEKTFKAALVRKLNRLPRSDFEPSPPGIQHGKARYYWLFKRSLCRDRNEKIREERRAPPAVQA